MLEKDNDILDKTILNEEWFGMDSCLIAGYKEYSCKVNGNRRKLLQSARDIHVEKLWDCGILKQNKCSMFGGMRVDQIFCNMEWEIASESGQVVLCGFYHRYWNQDRMRNQAFDMFGGRILDVKDKREKGISYFFQQLDEEICKGVTICVVPSHTKGNRNDSGIAELARRLARNGRVDKVDYLLRTKTIDKLAHGGSRDIKAQLDSIGVNPDMSVEGDVVLIVDDVTTSGASLEACRKILLEHGARRVAMRALGQSV